MHPFRKALTLTLIVLFIANVSLLYVPVSAGHSWSIETIDDNTASNPAVFFLDSNNAPQVAYLRITSLFPGTGTYELMWASQYGSSWNIQDVAPANNIWSIVVDSKNNPHILYDGVKYVQYPGAITGTYAIDVGLTYASWNGSYWSLQAVDPERYSGALALDSAGNPHIAYISNDTLKYASWSGNTWGTQNVDSGALPEYQRLSLALDNKGNPHILYAVSVGGNSSSEMIKHAVWSGSNWDIQTAVTNLSDDSFGLMALDSYGNPHFLFIKNNSSDLMYASLQRSGWNMQTVASNVQSAGYMALDSNDKPHIDYTKMTNGTAETVFEIQSGSNWKIQDFQNSTAVGEGPISIDSAGNTHLIYGVRSGGYSIACMYATSTSPEPANGSLHIDSSLILLLTVLTAVIISIGISFYYVHRKNRKIIS